MTSASRFAIDESSYTGADLLNSDQRFQGATAVAISDEEAARLIREFFPRLQAPELKYSSLSRRDSNRKPLLELQRTVLKNYPCLSYLCDKRFLLILMFLDYGVEPFYFERGIDFYKDGQNYALASLLHFCGPTLLGEQGFEKVLSAFQLAAKSKSPADLNALVSAVRATRWQKLAETFGPLAEADGSCLRAIAQPGVSTDAALVVLQSLISRTEIMSNGPYGIDHDRSKNLLRYHELLQDFIRHDTSVEFWISKIASLGFPLKLTSVAQVESRESPSVQIADVMIGALLEAANGMLGFRKSTLDPMSIISLYADEQFIHLIPSMNFVEQKDLRAGSQSSAMIDYFARNFRMR